MLNRIAIASLLALAIATLPALATNPPAIQWQRTFAGTFPGAQDTNIASVGTWVELTSGGGFIASGTTWDAGDSASALLLVKTNSSGSCEWQRQYQARYSVGHFCVRQTTDGGYILAGTADLLFPDCPWGDQPYLIKTDAAGVEQWHRFFLVDSGENGFCVRQTADHGYVVSGINPCKDSGLCVFKTDSLGALRWQKSYNIAYGWTTDFVPIERTNDGGYIIGTRSLLKTDSLGNVQWVRSYNQFSETQSLLQTTDGKYIASGCRRYGEHPWVRPDSMSIFLFKADQSGNLVWWRELTKAAFAGGYSVQRTSDGGYVVAGRVDTGIDTCHGVVIRTDSAGITQWTKVLDANSCAWCVRQTTDGGLVVAGWHYDSGPDPMRFSIWRLAPEQK